MFLAFKDSLGNPLSPLLSFSEQFYIICIIPLPLTNIADVHYDGVHLVRR